MAAQLKQCLGDAQLTQRLEWLNERPTCFWMTLLKEFLSTDLLNSSRAGGTTSTTRLSASASIRHSRGLTT